VQLINPADGSTHVVWSDIDDAWVELVSGVPALLPSGLVVTCADRDGSRRLIVDGVPVTPASLQVRSVVSVDNVIVFIANELDTPWITEVWSYDTNAQHLQQITEHGGAVSAVGSVDCLMTRVSTLEMDRAEFIVTSPEARHVIASHAETSLVQPNVRIVAVGASKIPVAILLPHDGSAAPLPVLFDPYGGPHAQRVVASRSAYNSAQWFADQGFVVVIADNAGTPGRGSVC
jgi:dipeptidyl-peptidase-4